MTSSSDVSSDSCEDVISGEYLQDTDIHSTGAIPEASDMLEFSPSFLSESDPTSFLNSNYFTGQCGLPFKTTGRSRWSSSSVTITLYVGFLIVTTCLLLLPDVSLARAINDDDLDRTYKKLEMETVKYLAQFGYLKGPTRETQDLKTRAELTRAIKALQKAGGIPQTGVPDRRTAELIAKPRCGNSDDFAFEGTSKRFLNHRTKRFTLATSKWPQTNLTFRFINYTPDMSKTKTRKIISEALRVWSDETPLSFTEVTHPHADIMIQFASNYHSDGYPFDGKGMVLAHAFFPSTGRGGDTHFDDDEEWNPSAPNSMDLFMVAAHEFGHSLGLAHSGDPSALMYPWYMGVDGHFRLPEDDKYGITSLYGTGEQMRDLPDKDKVILIPNSRGGVHIDQGPTYDTQTRPPKDDSDIPPNPCRSHFDALTVVRTEIFIFIGKWYWRLDSRKLVTKPIKIHHFWYGLPKDIEKIDAAFERPDGKIVFFSGDKYWIFNANQIIRGFPTEGRPITEYNIPADVKRIDAAFVWGYNHRTYLVSGDMYWKMNENNTFVEYDYPRDMGTWKGVPVPLDAAYQDESGKTYFFQKYRFWEFYDMKMETRPNYPKRIDLNWLNCPKDQRPDVEVVKEIRQGKDETNDENNKDQPHKNKNINKTSRQEGAKDENAAATITGSVMLMVGTLMVSYYHYLSHIIMLAESNE